MGVLAKIFAGSDSNNLVQGSALPLYYSYLNEQLNALFQAELERLIYSLDGQYYEADYGYMLDGLQRLSAQASLEKCDFIDISTTIGGDINIETVNLMRELGEEVDGRTMLANCGKFHYLNAVFVRSTKESGDHKQLHVCKLYIPFFTEISDYENNPDPFSEYTLISEVINDILEIDEKIKLDIDSSKIISCSHILLLPLKEIVCDLNNSGRFFITQRRMNRYQKAIWRYFPDLDLAFDGPNYWLVDYYDIEGENVEVAIPTDDYGILCKEMDVNEGNVNIYDTEGAPVSFLEELLGELETNNIQLRIRESFQTIANEKSRFLVKTFDEWVWLLRAAALEDTEAGFSINSSVSKLYTASSAQNTSEYDNQLERTEKTADIIKEVMQKGGELEQEHLNKVFIGTAFAAALSNVIVSSLIGIGVTLIAGILAILFLFINSIAGKDFLEKFKLAWKLRKKPRPDDRDKVRLITCAMGAAVSIGGAGTLVYNLLSMLF